MKTIELCPRPVLGPTRKKRFGQPATIAPRWACGLPSQTSASERPSRPRTRSAAGMSVTWKPVPKMIVSTSRSVPSARHDRARADLADGVGDDLDVLAPERRQVVVGDEHALAAHAVGRRELAAQLGVADLAVQVAQREALAPAHDARVAEAEHEALARPVDARAHEQLGGRQRAVQPPLPALQRAVRARHDPRRRALEEVQAPDARLDLRDELDRRGAGADHGHALAVEVVVVVPRGRVEGRPLEALEARQVGDRRRAERPGPEHERLRGQLAAARSPGASAGRPRPSSRRAARGRSGCAP